MESQGEPSQEAGDVAADAGAYGQEAGEKRAHGEEQTNDNEWEHESGRQEVVVGPMFTD